MPEIAEVALRLAIYARVSTEEQREGQTIDSQISELEYFARDKAWPVVGTYKDEAWSGGVMERPALDRLRDDAQKGLFDGVLINDVDRLARDVSHLGIIKRDLERNGIRVIFRKLPSETSPTYNLMVNILGSFAEFERELITDRTRRGRRHKVEVKKEYLSSHAAYGYRYTPNDPVSGKMGFLETIPEEVEVVRHMFKWVDEEGLSARRVMLRLNERKHQTRNGSATWAKSSVLRILKNEMYVGVWYYNKFQCCEPRKRSSIQQYRKRLKSSIRQRPKSEWLPVELSESLQIVPRDRWERVQRQITRNIALSPRNEKHVYVLTGLLRCGACGGPYGGTACHGKFYYRCNERCHKVRSVKEQVLNQVVEDAVRKIILNPDVILEPIRKLDAAHAEEEAQRTRMAGDVEKDAKQIDAEEQRLLDAYRTAVISSTQLGEQLEKLRARRMALDRRRTESANPMEPQEVESEVRDYCNEAADNLAKFTDVEWREFLRVIIRSIIFDGNTMKILGTIPLGDQINKGCEIRLNAPVPLPER